MSLGTKGNSFRYYESLSGCYVSSFIVCLDENKTERFPSFPRIFFPVLTECSMESICFGERGLCWFFVWCSLSETPDRPVLAGHSFSMYSKTPPRCECAKPVLEQLLKRTWQCTAPGVSFVSGNLGSLFLSCALMCVRASVMDGVEVYPRELKGVGRRRVQQEGSLESVWFGVLLLLLLGFFTYLLAQNRTSFTFGTCLRKAAPKTIPG